MDSFKTSKFRRPRKLGAAFVATAMVAAVVTVAATPVSALAAPANVYVPATVSGGIPTPATPLSADDCAVVIQMTGTMAAGLGTYEILDPATMPATRTYSDTEAVQYVVLPGGCDQVIDVNSTYSPPPWDESSGTGGVVFLGGSTLNLNANIDASAAGFASGDTVGDACDGTDGEFGPDWARAEGGSGGGGILGGGGGTAGHNGNNGGYNSDADFDSSPGNGGTVTAGGLGGANGDSEGFGPDGGAAGCVGNGGSADQVNGTSVSDFYAVGAGGGGGGSYGGGGGACSASSSGAYSAGGGGGGSYTGGGAGGFGGTNTGYGDANGWSAEPNGTAGNAAATAAIPDSSHYLNDGDARLVMGGAGGLSFTGDGSGPYDGGRGGGIVLLYFDDIIGGGGAALTDGGDGLTPTNGGHGSSGSGGGAGGQIGVYAATVTDATFSATGGIGGPAVEGTVGGLPHTGSAGASGGGGGIWFAGVGADDTNSGPNIGATSDASPLSASGLNNVSWAVSAGSPDAAFSDVTIGSTTFDRTQWAAIVSAANADSAVTFKPIAQSLTDAAGGAFTLAELVAAYPYFGQPDNPKNLGLGCTPGLGGTGLVSTSTDLPVSTLTLGVVELPDPPELADDEDLDNTIGESVEIDVVGNDPSTDIDPATVAIVGADPSGALVVPGEGTWTVNPTTGAITFTPLDGFTGDPAPIEYTASSLDGTEAIAPATVTVTYLPVVPGEGTDPAVEDPEDPVEEPAPEGDPDETPALPTLVDDASDNNQPGTPVTVDPLENDSSGVDPTTLQLLDPATDTWVSELTVPGEGVWSVDPVTGAVTFTPEASFTGDPTDVVYQVMVLGSTEFVEATIEIGYLASTAQNNGTASAAPPVLAFTGRESTALTLLGIMLVLTGAVMTLGSRRRRFEV